MALLLAPYNEAMRLGMGFNSYTQQLCVNDIVRKPGGVRASEKDLRSVDPTGGRKIDSSQDVGMLSRPTGTVVNQAIPQDGQSSVSQIVSWEAGFVDTVSQVTNSLNISGSLAITVDALGGGAEGGGEYVNSSALQKSDATYKVTVKVTNQKLIADDVSEFTPIPNVPAAKFNEVYGDSYISGFIEGGVFNALVMKELEDKNDLTKLGGHLAIKLKLTGVGEVKGEAKAEKMDENKAGRHSTTIKISWSGGGDIKPDTVTEWDIPTLTQVAMEFPDKVAACPQRTFAILTKYTSLRSYHEQTVKGSPLDYEIAGIYTSSLLDSYVEYKAMWKDIQQNITDLDQGRSTVKVRTTSDNLIAYGKYGKDDYDERMVKYNNAKQEYAKALSYNQITLEEPLAPNPVEPYAADFFGLDKARRDCRFEMIKIVREVNEVAANPKVAIDPNRNWYYLSPNIFRLLLPTSRLLTEKSPEEIQKMKEDLENEVSNSRKQIEVARAENERLKETLADRDEEKKRKDEETTKEKEKSAEEAANEKERLTAQENEAKNQREARDRQMQADLQKAQEEADASNRRRTKVEGALNEVKDALRKTQDEMKRYAEMYQAEHGEREKAEEARKLLNNITHAGSMQQEVVVYSIIYGNQQLLGNAALENGLRLLIQHGWPLKFSNEIFQCDPQPGQRKTGVIVYQRRGQEVKTVTANEGDSVTLP